MAKAGFAALLLPGLAKILVFIVLAPVLGLALGFSLMVATLWTFHRFRPSRVDGLFRRLQLLSAASYSLGHGTNDAQKTMGIIAILLFSSGYLGPEFYVPVWVILAAHASIGDFIYRVIGAAAGSSHHEMGFRIDRPDLQTPGHVRLGQGKIVVVERFLAKANDSCNDLLGGRKAIP